jgi:hypothetical protein
MSTHVIRAVSPNLDIPHKVPIAETINPALTAKFPFLGRVLVNVASDDRTGGTKIRFWLTDLFHIEGLRA